jgi:hypothetical protein
LAGKCLLWARCGLRSASQHCACAAHTHRTTEHAVWLDHPETVSVAQFLGLPAARCGDDVPLAVESALDAKTTCSVIHPPWLLHSLVQIPLDGSTGCNAHDVCFHMQELASLSICTLRLYSLQGMHSIVLTLLLNDLPGSLFFTTYTMLLLFWAYIYHQACGHPTAHLRLVYLYTNAFVYAMQVGLLCLCGINSVHTYASVRPPASLHSACLFNQHTSGTHTVKYTVHKAVCLGLALLCSDKSAGEDALMRPFRICKASRACVC